MNFAYCPAGEIFFDDCRIPADAFRARAPADLPARDRRLLVHAQDMTSTLAAFHGSALRVELIKRLAYADTKAHEFPPRRNGVYPV